MANKIANFVLTLLVMSFSAVVDGIQMDQVAKTIALNETFFAAYNSSTSPCRIDCADVETMARADFVQLEKVWMFNGSETFDANSMVFIDGNRSVEFASLGDADTGKYECCVRSTSLAYQSFVCYATELVVVDEIPAEVNATEAPLSPSWNVVVEDGATLHCQFNHTYFVRMFDDNVTDVVCSVDGAHVDDDERISTSNALPTPLYGDLLIRDFNASVHAGIYACNATIIAKTLNETEPETTSVTFTVIESLEQNEQAELLGDVVVRHALQRVASGIADVADASILAFLIAALADFFRN